MLNHGLPNANIKQLEIILKYDFNSQEQEIDGL